MIILDIFSRPCCWLGTHFEHSEKRQGQFQGNYLSIRYGKALLCPRISLTLHADWCDL